MLPPKSIPCSVLILTRNSARTIERCLKNLSPFGEVLVHDANSEDDTVVIAKRYGARVLRQYDTEEKSVRVKDFTEMRLRQRDAAAYDWVLYLDSDEELSSGAVAEIGEILKTVGPKTIIKIRRVPVIADVPRIRGDVFQEVMPRVHHRRSGATLRQGKTVHEKYEYDATFLEIALRHPLYVPLPSVQSLRAKDDRYILLEIERLRASGYTWGLYLRWVMFREPLIMLSILGRILLKLPEHFRRDSVPLAHHLRYVRYHWRLFRAITGFMFERTFSLR
ncbi:MAG: glycosyltransferase [Candidatus Peribacteraceae bacterium]